MSKTNPEKEPSLAGRRRIGTVVSEDALRAIDLMSLRISTTASRTMAVILEEWLTRHGLLDSKKRVYPPDVYEAHVKAAKSAKSLDVGELLR